MKCLAIPSPNVCITQSRKFSGVVAAFCCASISPSTHSYTVCGSRSRRLFWNGYGTKRFSIHTHASRLSSV
jgi:hypothetical protein